MTSSNQPPPMLWLKPEPFTIGTLPVAPHPRLTISNIRKIMAYAKSKGQAGYPNISYTIWRHIACNKLQLPEDIAWTYFLTFDLINETTPDQRLERDRKFSVASDQKVIDAMRNRLSVSTMRFVLFLYLQHIHKISLRASLVSGSDEWPTRAKSPDIDTRGSTSGGKVLEEGSHLTFVLSNLNDILEMLCEPCSSNVGETKCLTIEAVEALGFLISGSVDKAKSLTPLVDIAAMPALQNKTGFTKSSHTFAFRSFLTWIRSLLAENPFGVSACLATGQFLNWSLLDEKGSKTGRTTKGRIFSNASIVRKEHTKGNKLIFMSQVSQETVARSSNNLDGSTIKIHRCNRSFIYILSPIRAVSIEKCCNSTIVLGAVEVSIDLIRCDSVTIVAACRRFSTLGSKSCTFHLLTPNRPLVFTGNEDLTFAPYNTTYPQLEDHMKIVGLSTALNLWDQPLTLGTEYQQDDTPVWELMKPESFFSLAIPFEMKGGSSKAPKVIGELPSLYVKANEEKFAQFTSWKKHVRKSKLTSEQSKVFAQIIETRFEEWLKLSGNKDELDSLLVKATSAKNT